MSGFQSGDWSYAADGYYIHRNRVYLQGFTMNFQGSPPTDGSLYAAVPAGIRPLTTQTCKAVLIGPDPATPGVNAPTHTLATFFPDGTISVDVPDFANTAPTLTSLGSIQGTTPRPMFPDPFQYQLVIANVSWMRGPELNQAYSSVSLAPYLVDFDDIDSQIGVHGARIHLDGHIRARFDGAHIVTNSLPSTFIGGIDPLNRDMTTAKHPKFQLAMNLSSFGQLDIANQDVLPPRPGPAAWFPPSDISGVGQNNLGGSGNSRIAGLSGHPTRLRDMSGHPIPPSPWNGPEPGGERIQTAFEFGFNGSLLTPDQPGIFVETLSQLAAFSPRPDWIAIQIAWEFTASSSYPIPLPDPIHDIYVAPTEIDIDVDEPCVLVDVTNGTPIMTLPTTVGFPGAGADSGFPTGSGEGFGSGYLAPPGYSTLTSSGYDVDPNQQASMMLWRPEAAPNGFMTTIKDGQWFSSSGSLLVWILPYWYSRRNWIREGDIIDLTGCGWQSPFALTEEILIDVV